jgi:hypothetical protein
MRKGLFVVFVFLPFLLRAQNFEKVVFDRADSANGYYLAVRPLSGNIRGVVVVFTWFKAPESIPPETKLHNVASVNDLLTIYASTGPHVAPKADAPDYWSFAPLFWIKAGPKIDEAVLRDNIQAYYEGLVVVGGRSVKHAIPADKMVPTKVELTAIKAEADDVNTYKGTIWMLDYMAMKPMRLNIMVHVIKCDNPHYVPVLLQLSPKPYDDEVWTELWRVKKQFRCQ